MAYYIQKHVSFCRRGDLFVFLDIRKDEYTLVQGATARALLSLLHDANSSAPLLSRPAASHFPDASELHNSLENLVDSGILTTEESAGKPVAQTWVELPTDVLYDPTDTSTTDIHTTEIQFHHIVRFFTACIVATLRLRAGSLAGTIASVQSRNFRNTQGSHTNLDEARRLVSIFNRLRPFFPRSSLCLFDSLALLEFLARYHLFPNWIFGVQIHPWAAHCWVQQDTVAFNEGIEEASRYLPILIV